MLESAQNFEAQTIAVPKAKSERLVSLDVFRGITIMGMILVNNPGSWGHIYPSLEHAKWDGVTPTDLIFPFFLFIVGVAITLSLTKRKERGDDKQKLLLQIVRRGISIFAVGLLLGIFPLFRYNPIDGFSWYNFSTMRIPGVLQRIGVVYFFASLIFLYTKPKMQAIIGISLLIIYHLLMTLVPVPGQGYASLEPSKNLGAWLDRLLLNGHLWVSSKTWDPEGILSTVPAISTAVAGIMLGHWMRTKNDPLTKIVWMYVAACFLVVISMFWDMTFPINKSLWSPSYVVYAAGLALFFFATIYFLVDIKGYKTWTTPFLVYGMNAITVFFLSGAFARILGMIYIYSKPVIDKVGQPVLNASGQPKLIWVNFQSFIVQDIFGKFLVPINASLLWAILYILFWLGIMWIFYAKKIFIKL